MQNTPQTHRKQAQVLLLLLFQGGVFLVFIQGFTNQKFTANIKVSQLADYLTGESKTFLCTQLH